MVWKVVNNSDSGTVTKHGGNDIDKITTAFNGNSVSDPIIYNVDLNTLRANSNISGQILRNNGTKFVSSSATTISASTYLIYIDPTDGSYKAVNGRTGVIDYTHATNATSLLDSIVDNITPAGNPTCIEFGPGDFNMTTVFDNFTATDVGNLTIKGQGIGVTNLIVTSSITGSAHVLDLEGGVTGSQTNLTGNALVSSPTVTVADASSLAAGDYVLLRSTKAWSTASSANGKQGEIRRIISKATNTLTFDKWIQDTYNTVDTSNVIKLNMLRNITLEGFTVKAGSGYTGTNVFVFCGYIDMLKIKNVETIDYRKAFEGSILVRSCHNFDVDCVVHQTPAATFNDQYGVCIGNACELGRLYVTGKGKFRHTQTIDTTTISNFEGQVRDVTISGTSEATDEAHFDSHACGENITWHDCRVDSQRTDVSGYDARALQCRSKKNRIVNCSFANCIGSAILISEDATGTIISGNTIVNSRQLDTASQGIGMEIKTGANNVIITGNSIIDNKRQPILLSSTTSGHIITGNLIANTVTIVNPGIDANNINDVVVSGNRITGCSKAINMAGTSDFWVITGNSLRGNTGASTIVGSNNVNTNNTT